jgi:DNA-binding NtrC family response regulator
MIGEKAMTETILLVVSDPVIRKVLAAALESAGYVVQPAGGVGDAVARLKECTPALLIIRHYTESVSGHDAALYLRRISPGIPVLIIGGLLDDPALENREIIHGFEIFPKPFKSSELLDKVKEVLSKHPSRNTGERGERIQS